MKKPGFILIVLLTFPALAGARINFIEQWKPGIESNILDKDSYDISLNMTASSDNKFSDLFSLPATFTYSPFEKAEFGISLGIASQGSETGVSDLNTGLKYSFMKEDASQKPSICGEFGFSFPTADYRKNLGFGGVGINLDWIIQKTIKDIKGHLVIGYLIHTDNPDNARPGNEFQWNLGGEYLLSKTMTAYGALKGINHAPSRLNGQSVANTSLHELYLTPGIKYRNSTLFNLYFSPFFGLTDDSYNLIFFAGMEMKI